MTNKVGSFAIFALVTMVALTAVSKQAEAVTCNIIELSPCLASFTSSAPPSTQCCAKLKEQTPCLCQYAKDPTYGQYVNSPQAKKVAVTCQVTIQC